MKNPLPLCCAVSLFLTGGCAVGPNYHGPPAALWTTPEQYKNGTAGPARPSDMYDHGDWWRVFRDPVLNTFEDTAMARNQDLYTAAARIEEERALDKVAASDFFPHIGADPRYTREHTSNTEPVQTAELVGRNPFGGLVSGGGGGSQNLVLSTQPLSTTYSLFHVPADLDWEVDLFGRVRRNYEAARANRQAAVADFQSIRLSVASDVAGDYFTLRALDTETGVLNTTIRARKDALHIAQERLDAGLTSELDVTRAQSDLASDTATLESVLRSRGDMENAIATLAGVPASDLKIASRPLDLNLEPPAIPAGLPSRLLERRPDVAEAERELAAANARIGVAVAAFFPTIRITGAAGWESADLGLLFAPESHFWQIGPSVTLPIFEGGKNFANLKAARARYSEALGHYRGKVLAAFQDVETALNDIRTLQKQYGAELLAVAAASRAFELSQRQYARGTVGFLDVLDAERTLLNDQQTAAGLLGQRLQATVQLIKALGGKWS